MYNVIAFKVDYESKHGPVSCEALAKLYEGVKFSNPDDAAPWTAVRLSNEFDAPLLVWNTLGLISHSTDGSGVTILCWHCLHNGKPCA